MFDRLMAAVFANRLTVMSLFFLVAAAGAVSAIHLPIDAVPDITNVQVMINTKTLALDPEQIEKTVTALVEAEMSGLPNLEESRSLSKYGLSQVILVFTDDTDVYWAREQVAQRLQTLRHILPEGITPELAPMTTGLGEVVMYTVTARPGTPLAAKDEQSRLLYLRTVQDTIIRPQLRMIRGVADIDSNGGYKKEIHINVNLSRLEQYGLTFETLTNKLETVGDNFGGGIIQSKNNQVIVRTAGALRDLDEIRTIPLKLDFRGRPVRLAEIADIREDHTQRLGAATVNGKEAVLGTALMYIGANSRTVAREIEAGIGNLRLPDAVEVHILYSRSFLVDATLHTVVTNLAEGAGLVVIVLLLILGQLRAALIVSLAIPVSMLFAVVGMKVLGISANLMSLGAIDFGLLVDGSVVMIENVLRRAALLPPLESRTQRIQLVTSALKEVHRPLLFGLLIIMLVYVPVLALEGIEGKMFHPMAKTVLLALAASLLVAFLLMPVLAYYFLTQKPKHRVSPNQHASVIFTLMLRAYKPILTFTIRHPKPCLTVAGAVGCVAIFLFLRLGSDFIPKLDEADLVLGLVRDTRMSLNASVQKQQQAERLISQSPAVETVFSRLGTPESATDPMGVNFADTFVIVKKTGPHRVTSTNKNLLLETLIHTIDTHLPGHEISPTQPIEMRLNEVLEGSRADVTLRIFGPNLQNLAGFIDQAEDILKTIPGTKAVEMDALTAIRKGLVLDIKLNHHELSRYGISIKEANHVLRMAMGGQKVGNYYDNNFKYPVVIHLDEKYRDDLNLIARIPVGLAEGGSIPLHRVATFVEQEQVTTIARSFGKRYAAVSVFLKDRDVKSFVAEAQDKIHKSLKLPKDYTLSWGGQFKHYESARKRLMLVIPLLIATIFVLLLKVFNNTRQAFLVFSSIPFAMTGGVFSLYFCGLSLSVSAAIGFIALLGIAVLNSMVLVDFIQQERGHGLPPAQAVLESALTRLRPVLMTALVASLGFLPMAINQGMGAEVQRPLATVVIGGLLTSTFLTLFLLPTLYLLIEKKDA